MMNPGEEAIARSRWLPIVEREQRHRFHEHFDASGTWNVDFVVMMGLSTALASFGLLNNSAAAVIGAMLVAPLILATVVLIIPLGNRLQTQLELSQVRPASYPLSTEVRNIILDKVDSEPGIEVIAMVCYPTAPKTGAQVFLSSGIPVPRGFVDYIESAVRSVSGPDAIVRVTIVHAPPGADRDAPKIETEED